MTQFEHMLALKFRTIWQFCWQFRAYAKIHHKMAPTAPFVLWCTSDF